MKTLLPAMLAALALAACASNPAVDPVQVRLNDIDTRLGGVERVVSNQSLVDMSRRIDALEAQLREQRGSVEVLARDSDTARKSQRDLYADLDRRLSALESGAHAPIGAATGAAAAAGGGGAADSGAAGAAPADDQAAYAAAFEQLKGGNYPEAIAAFQEMMTNYPSSTLLDNAQYWIGEAYYVTRDYEHAAVAFRTVGERWPTSRKAPDALLKLGYTQFEQKHLVAARATLQQVVERYGGSDAARLAQERLQKLPPEGH
ncbi:MAG: tol-pal system protein YbgF [Gammaproteobacteria bacterium]|nr:tol-pal system protein YbgF [Gammaproteobacteria bacterium]